MCVCIYVVHNVVLCVQITFNKSIYTIYYYTCNVNKMKNIKYEKYVYKNALPMLLLLILDTLLLEWKELAVSLTNIDTHVIYIYI